MTQAEWTQRFMSAVAGTFYSANVVAESLSTILKGQLQNTAATIFQRAGLGEQPDPSVYAILDLFSAVASEIVDLIPNPVKEADDVEAAYMQMPYAERQTLAAQCVNDVESFYVLRTEFAKIDADFQVANMSVLDPPAAGPAVRVNGQNGQFFLLPMGTVSTPALKIYLGDELLTECVGPNSVTLSTAGKIVPEDVQLEYDSETSDDYMVYYNGQEIYSGTDSVTLQTAGKLCQGDIEIRTSFD